MIDEPGMNENAVGIKIPGRENPENRQGFRPSAMIYSVERVCVMALSVRICDLS